MSKIKNPQKRELKHHLFLILFPFLLLNNLIFCGIGVYPDSYVQSDAAFESNRLQEGIKDQQIYKLAYFTNTNSSPDIISYKHNLRYKPDYSTTQATCTTSKAEATNEYFNHLTQTYTTQTDKNKYFSEEIELLQHICYGSHIQFNSPFPVLHNTGYILTMKLPIAVKNPGGALIDFSIIATNDLGVTNRTELVCTFLASNATFFKLKIQSKITDTNKIHMIFTCQDDTSSFDLVSNTDDQFFLDFKSTGGQTIITSFYQIILEDDSFSYLENSGFNTIVRTNSGMNNCQEGIDDCLLGFKCSSSGTCKKCHFSCLECYNEENSNQCKGCFPLTDPEFASGPICPVNYVDMTQFQDLEVNVPLMDEEFHERTTMGLWLFFADIERARNGNTNIFHIVLKDRYVISIVPNEISIGVYCHAYEDLYRMVTSETQLASEYLDRSSDYVLTQVLPNEDQLKYIENIRDLSGRWFHVTCALSFDHKEYYMKTMLNGEPSVSERYLRHENLYYDSITDTYVENDVYFRHVIREEKNLVVQFKNFWGSASNIYLRYFQLFQEFIPPNYQYMYYDYTKGDLRTDYILYQIPFTELTHGITYSIKGYNYLLVETDLTLQKKSNSELDLTAPYNFKPLRLQPTNYIYKYVDCKFNEKQSLLVNTANHERINWDDNKPLFCEYFLITRENQCTNGGLQFCSSPTGARTIIYPGMTNQQGYCDYPCSGGMACDMTRMRQGEHLDPHATGGQGFCDAGGNTNIYNLFYTCENTDKKYYLQYSSFYNPGDIVINIDSLSSYIIEVWYYPDFFLSDPTRQGKFKYIETYKNYIFYANTVQAYFRYSDKKKLIVEDEYSILTTPYYHPYEWNKLVFYGLFKPPNYLKTFYINNLINDPVEFSHVKKPADGVLTQIRFFSEQEIEGQIYKWSTGYYRGLKVWNGDQAAFSLTVLYDNIYTSGLGRASALVRYYPLTNEYFGNNKISEILNVENYELRDGTYSLKRYNYCSKFDYIRSQYPSLGYYLQADADEPKVAQCGTGCARCWNAGSNCYECVAGYMLTLNRECRPIVNYYFKSPCIDKTKSCDALLTVPQDVWKVEDKNHGITVNFWTKPIGFDSSGEVLIIQYSYDDRLVFNPNNGLTLYSSAKVIANDPNFRERIGSWTFISLAFYHGKTDLNKGLYFEQMISFEVNDEIFPTQTRTERVLKFDAFEIFPAYYGLVFNVNFYHEFIVGAYGFATNKGNLISPFTIPLAVKTYLVPGAQASSCFDYHDFTNNNGDNFGCAPDTDILFSSFADSFTKYIEYKNGRVDPYDCDFKGTNKDSVSKCLNACKGVTKFSCSCMNKNYNSQYMVRGEVDYCRSLDWINFSKARKITINNIQTARETKKFTMQFWIFILNYKPGNFDGATFIWKYHNIIKIIMRERRYYISCETWKMDGEEKFSVIIDEIEMNTAEWKFISCAVNFPEMYMYLNTNSEADGPIIYKQRINPNVPIPELTSNYWTTLEISDDTTLNEWGYLFYRQIHLWKDAYFNAEFLSRVNILTQSKFPYLLHSWDPAFRSYKDSSFQNNFIVKDIVGIAEDFEVKYEGQLGFNIIEESDIYDVTICSEDGEYYDMILKKCLQFSDLGSLEDFTFSEIPPSFHGSYSMAFWIFFEDSATISAGIHFKWERHLQVSIIKGAQLQGYCFPQGYYSDIIPNTDITYKYSQMLNAAMAYLVEDSSESGVWIFVLCSVSNFDKKFFLRGNGATESKPIVAETLYTSDTTGSILNTYPYRYYFPEVDETTPKTSKLFFENMKNDKKMYIRNFMLFKDYIPAWYADAFKHTDLAALEENMMLESMVFVVNFADFNLEQMELNYYVINQYNAGSSSTFTKTKKKLKLKSKASSSFELCTNFAFIKIGTPKMDTLCKEDNYDETISNLYYCNDEKNHIVCKEKKYITQDIETGKVICSNSCQQDYIRVPGAPAEAGICSILCDKSIFSKCPNAYSQLLDYKSYYQCSTNYDQIAYSCLDKSLDEKSAFFFSRCYNQPNFYVEISNESKKKFENGYFYEFWFKLDRVLINQNFCTTTADKEFYLYSTPHSIYKDLTENQFYYKVIDSVYSAKLNGINDYEWNKIVIKTTLGNELGQNVYIYVNFDVDNIKVSITNIASSVKMQLQHISFCSKEENGFCTPAGFASIAWGSAYYRNIRIWELYSSSINSIQDYNINLFTDKTGSLKLFYPLTIKYMDKNKLLQIIGDGNPDTIFATHEESTNFNSEDEYSFYNYATNFDWGVEKNENKRKFISAMEGEQITYQDCGDYCERCFTSANTNCYKCNVGYVLKGMTCVFTDGRYFVKVPTASGSPVQFVVPTTMKDKPGITIDFFMKFEGAIQNPASSSPQIFILSPSTYMSYNTETSYLEFFIEGQVGFRYKEFYNYIGQWIPVSIAVYSSESNELYPHMFTFSLNKEDLPFVSGYTLTSVLPRTKSLSLGNEVVCLFADLRVYDTFIQGSFGQAISSEKSNGAILEYSLIGGVTTCTKTEEIVEGGGVPLCVEDYTDYIAKSCGTNTDLFFDLSLINLEQPCSDCTGYCKTKCFNGDNTQCTCDMTHGLYWLRRKEYSLETYCEYLPSMDYSVVEDISMKVPTSSTNESTIEFWVFIYSYNQVDYKFEELILEWNLHNRVDIYNTENTLTAKCQSLYDFDDPTRYSEYMLLTISFYQWNLIRCGTDILSEQKKYFFNGQEEELITIDFPNRTNTTSIFNIRNVNTHSSFGYVFIKEIKLWQQYNFKYIDTSYIDLKNLVGQYDLKIKKSTGIFPGLITYIKSEFPQESFEEVKTHPYKYKVINECGDDELGAPYPKTYEVKRLSDFLGYNIIDPDNNGLYGEVKFCPEGFYFDSASNDCLEQSSLTQCQYVGDAIGNCITCPEERPFIHPETGDCVEDCGARYYKREDVNECRACHHTCYTCVFWHENDCRSCIDDRYYVEDEHICVTHCQERYLVESTSTPNLCVPFNAKVELVIPPPEVPIDNNTFEEIVVNITQIDTKRYYCEWNIEPNLTAIANNDTEMEFEVPWDTWRNESDPPDPDIECPLSIKVNNTFFELTKKYVISFTIFSYNILKPELAANYTEYFTLIMNSWPVEGGIEVIPSTGLHDTTIFLIKCQNWTDDTSNTTDLEYYFYAQEHGIENTILLHDWSPTNELITNFTLEKDALYSNGIDIYCRIRDEYLAETKVKTNITVVTSLTSGLYSLDKAIGEYYIPGKQVSGGELYHLSEVLKSFGYDLTKILKPQFTQTIYAPSLDKTLVTKTDPICTSDLCNDRGDCTIIDEFLVCYCKEGYLGTNCHIEKNDGNKLIEKYNELYNKLIAVLQNSITYDQFRVMYNLFDGAQYFSPDSSFFSSKLEVFINMAMNSFPFSIDNNTYEYIDLLDFYYTYELDLLNKAKQDKVVNTGLNFRNMSISVEDREPYQKAFEYIHNKLLSLIYFVLAKKGGQPVDYNYSSKNFYIRLKSINPTFTESEFFEERTKKYHTFPHFMKCLNYIETQRLNNPYFQAFMIYIEYLNFPFSYDSDIYDDNTSPLIELRFLDGISGKDFELNDCTGQNYINIDMPFTNYRWLDQINLQRKLYDPTFYKAPDDPIFSDPVYINESGYVSNDTVEQRIEKYHRKYNFSCRYYDTNLQVFLDDGVVFTNFTNDTNYIQFNTSHLSRFTTFFKYNNATFKIKGRFYYVERPILISWKDNFKGNAGFIIFVLFLAVYALFTLLLGCYDKTNYVEDSLLEGLKLEIVKCFLPYRSKKQRESEAINIIPMTLTQDLIKQERLPVKTREKNLADKKAGVGFNIQRHPMDIADEKGDYLKNDYFNNKNDLMSSDKLTSGGDVAQSGGGDLKSEKRSIMKIRGVPNFFHGSKVNSVEGENIMASNNKKELSFAKEIAKFYRSDKWGDANERLNANHLPNDFEDRQLERERRLNTYGNLSLTFKEYLCKNIGARNLIINPFVNISLFCPRWKKLVVFTSNVASLLLMTVVFLTNDENATDKNFGLIMKYAIFSILVSDAFIHILAFMFQVTGKQRRRLLKLVLTEGQLIILKEYNTITCNNNVVTVIGLIISYALWLFTLYMCFTFYAVWKIQNKAFIYCAVISLVGDLLVFDILYEFFLALLYLGRKGNICLRVIGELLSRIRNHRCMAIP